MRKYLSTLHERPHAHKKRFALVTAGSFTLLVFAIWALATFGSAPVATSGTEASANRAVLESSPIGSLMRGIGAGFKAFIGTTNEMKESLEVVNYESGFRREDSNSLNNYGE